MDDRNWRIIIFVSLFHIVLSQDTFYFSSKPEDMDVIEGSEVLLRCDVSNRQHIVFSWAHNNKPIVPTSRRFQEGSHLHILRVTREEDAGTFSCIATNKTSGYSLVSEAALNIQWIDKIATVELKRPKPEELVLNTEVLLKCQIMGNPDLLFDWYHNTFRLFNKNRIKILDKGSKVRITNVTAEDNGIYSWACSGTWPGLAWPRWPGLASGLAWPHFWPRGWPGPGFWPGLGNWPGLGFGLCKGFWPQIYFYIFFTYLTFLLMFY